MPTVDDQGGRPGTEIVDVLMERIEVVGWGDELAGVEIGSTGLSGVGTGGALTKVSAARQAAERGTAVILTATTLVSEALRGEPVGTWFAPSPSTEDASAAVDRAESERAATA